MVNLRTGAEFLLVKSLRLTQSLSSFLTLIKNSVPVLEISKFFIKDCTQFMYSINKRFRRRFGRHIYFKINNSGRAFDYYCVPKINKELN